MILFFDTETTGLVDPNMPPDHECQPHLVQLAMLLTEPDGTERASASLIVRPDGWLIPTGAAAVHKITTEIAQRCGVSERTAVVLWTRFLDPAEMVVAHNLSFDTDVIEAAMLRFVGTSAEPRLGSRTRYCTMGMATPILNLPPTERMVAAGFNKPKTPKLQECVRHFFGEDLPEAHDALADVRACARVFFHIKAMERSA